jgi:hypothetical protein
MPTRRKTGRRFQLEPMEGRVSLSGIGRSLPQTTPPAFGPVPYGSNAGGAGDGLVPLTSGPVAYGSNGIRFGQEGNAVDAGTASPFQKVREA